MQIFSMIVVAVVSSASGIGHRFSWGLGYYSSHKLNIGEIATAIDNSYHTSTVPNKHTTYGKMQLLDRNVESGTAKCQ